MYRSHTKARDLKITHEIVVNCALDTLLRGMFHASKILNGPPEFGHCVLETHAFGHRGLSLLHQEAFHYIGIYQLGNANVPGLFHQTFLCQLMLGINKAHKPPWRLSPTVIKTPTSASWSMRANGTRVATICYHLVPSST